MTDQIDKIGYFRDMEEYRSFWETNLQKMDEISSRIERNLVNLEKKYLGFEESYEELISSIDLLLSIYASYNNLKGTEYLLRLKACLSTYKKKYTHESIRFGLLYHLHAKVIELRDIGFTDFPGFPQRQKTVKKPREYKKDFIASHRWVTFQRLSSWFITPYELLTIKDHVEADIRIDQTDGHPLISCHNRLYSIIDPIMNAGSRKSERINHYIIRNYGGKEICYPAFATGRRILAGRDVIKSGLRPFHGTRRRFIRLFGVNHIYLDN